MVGFEMGSHSFYPDPKVLNVRPLGMSMDFASRTSANNFSPAAWRMENTTYSWNHRGYTHDLDLHNFLLLKNQIKSSCLMMKNPCSSSCLVKSQTLLFSWLNPHVSISPLRNVHPCISSHFAWWFSTRTPVKSQWNPLKCSSPDMSPQASGLFLKPASSCSTSRRVYHQPQSEFTVLFIWDVWMWKPMLSLKFR